MEHTPDSIIEIPILPHVKCVLIGIYGPEPIMANNTNLLGKALEHLIANRYTQEDPVVLGPMRCELIKMAISLRLKPHYMAFKPAFSLGVFFEKMFHKILHQHVIAQARCNRPVKVAIRDFYDLYNLTEEMYPFASAEDSYYRFLRHNSNLSIPRQPKGRINPNNYASN